MPVAEAKATEQTGAGAPSTESAGQTGGSVGNSIDDLLGGPTEAELSAAAAPAEDAEDAPEQPDATEDTEAEEQAGEPAKPSGAQTIEQRMRVLAQKYNVDPDEPGNAKWLRDLAITEKRADDKEAHIQSLKAKPDSDGLTEFERRLFGKKDAQPGDTKPRDAGQTGVPANGRPAASSGPVFNDIGNRWTSAADAIKDELDAWGNEQKPPDFNRIHEVRQADFRRRAGELIQPGHPFRQAVESWVESRLRDFHQKELGDVLPAVRESIAESRAASNRMFALQQLTADKAAGEDFAELFKDNGGTVEYDGESFPDNPFNRIVGEFPQVLSIRVQHDDPNTADRLTKIEQYRAVLNLYRKQKLNGVTPDKAKNLVEAGRQMEKRSVEVDRARQAINGGRSAGAGKSSGPGNYIKELQDSGSGERGIPLSAILRK